MNTKILFITQKRNDAIWIVDKAILKELNSLDHDFHFLPLRKKWNSLFWIMVNYCINTISFFKYWFLYDKFYFSRENPYVIFLNTFFPSKTIVMCVHHVENYWGKHFIWKAMIRSVSEFVAISEFTASQLIWLWVDKSLITINYNWISETYFPEKIVNFLKFPYILYVWSELERKNLKNLLLWFKSIIKKYPKIKLIKVWKAWTNEEIFDSLVNNLWLQDAVIIKREFISEETLRKFYSNALFYVSVSTLEWFWLTIPEALACWTPVLVSKIWPFLEIVWKSQISVDPLDVVQIEKWMEKYIIDTTFREKMIKESLPIAKKFSRKTTANNLLWIVTMWNSTKNNELIHNKIAHSYNKRHTEIYNEIEQKRLKKTILTALSFSAKKNNIKSLDYWAGTWNLSKYFEYFDCTNYAIDLSEKSLSLLQWKYKKTTTKKFDWTSIPFENGYFDIIWLYSVVHHIPNYLDAIVEICDKIAPWGILYIDHEASLNKWKDDPLLEEYYAKNYNTFFKIKKAVLTGEIFHYPFRKWLFIRAFINKRYQNEWDIHVFKDDYVDWILIQNLLEKKWFTILESKNYLVYDSMANYATYLKYRDIVADTTLLIAQKNI